MEITLAAGALARLKDHRGTAALKRFLGDASGEKRQLALGELIRDHEEVDKRLLSEDIDGVSPWLDPAGAISQNRIAAWARTLNLSEEEVRSRYIALAEELQLPNLMPAPKGGRSGS